MGKCYFSFLMVVALIAINELDFGKAEEAIRGYGYREHERSEERVLPLNGLTRLKGLFRSDKNKMKKMNFDKRSASEALRKVKALVGLSKTPTKISPTKYKNLETYARDNPDKWDAMSYYMETFYGVVFVTFVAGGAIYGVWKYGS